MKEIKTREKVKDIKVLDRSAVVGQRMKNAFIRSKRNAAALMDDRQATPSEYAEDKVEFAADDLAHDTANVAVSGTKTVVRQGRKLFQRQREKRAAERPPARVDVERPVDTANSIVERGRTFAKKQAAKWAERKRQVKNRAVQSDRPPQVKPQDAAKAPRQVETAVNAVETPVKAPKRPAQAMGQTAKATAKGAKGTVKSAQRTVKTAQRTAKGTVKTAQRTSKTAIKTADHTARAAQKTAQATAKAAKMTARATAKTAATTAKAAAKGVSATVKAMIASVKALVAAIAAGGHPCHCDYLPDRFDCRLLFWYLLFGRGQRHGTDHARRCPGDQSGV